MDIDKLKQLAEKAIDEYFEDIDSVVDNIVDNIIESHGIKDEDMNVDDITFLKTRVMRGILKLD